MATIGKKYRKAEESVDRNQRYMLEQALEMVKKLAFAKFDETVDVAVKLGIDPKKSEQMVRGSVVLPHGTGKTARVLVFAKGEKEKEARDNGADFVGAEDMVEKINGGWMDFDAVVATPDMMGVVGRLGKVLGPRGLMPNPKTGTVTFEVARAIKDIKAGKVEYRTEKGGIIHATIGKVSFTEAALLANFTALVENLVRQKPPTSKGHYLKAITLSSTMGPGVKVDMSVMQAQYR